MELEAWLHEERWLPPHLPLSEVKFAIATVLLFLPTVVVVHKVAVILMNLVKPQREISKKKN